MRSNQIFIWLRLVKLNSKILFINIIEIKNTASDKIISMFPKIFITNHAQCSFLKLNKYVRVGVTGSTPYRNAAWFK